MARRTLKRTQMPKTRQKHDENPEYDGGTTALNRLVIVPLLLFGHRDCRTVGQVFMSHQVDVALNFESRAIRVVCAGPR